MELKDRNGITILPPKITRKKKIVCKDLPYDWQWEMELARMIFFTSFPDEELLTRQGGLCFYCRRPLLKDFTADHFLPKSYGYGLQGNKVLACQPCNVAKADGLPTKEEASRFLLLYTGNGNIFHEMEEK